MNYISLFSTFVITTASLFLLKPVADRFYLMDIPGGRKCHIAPTPLIGGLGIYLGTFTMCLLTPGLFAEYSALLILTALVLFVGVIDDAKELRVSVRMVFHTLAALLMAVVAGVKLETLGDIVGLGAVDLGVLAIPVTVFATLGGINAINMADGLDGLSGGLVLIALGFIGITAFTAGNISLLSFVSLLACAVAAFLMMNFRVLWKKSAMVYLGDAGSTMLGFILAWLLIDSSQGNDAVFAPVYALWFLALPLADTVYLFIARSLRGKSPFEPAVDHIHHKLIKRGLDVKTTVLLLYAVALMFGTIGLIGYLMQVQEGFMFLAFLVLFLFYVYVRLRIQFQ